jgi:thioredoxin reductase (NADPH)
MAQVKVFGADWCPLTKRALAHLKEIDVEYQYTDIDKDREAAKWVAAQNDGKEKKPTIDIDGEILTEPSNDELDKVLGAKGLLN